MSKICGFITTSALQKTNEAQLQAMLAAMRHNPGAQIESVTFCNGAIGVIRNAAPDQGCATSRRGDSSCFALVGDILGLETLNGSNPQDADNPFERAFAHFEQHGEEMLKQADGVFCLAYYNAAQHSLTIANDRYGFSPLYYYADARGFWFASEIKALLKAIEIPEPDWEAYADFFYVGHMLGRRTLFKNIHALESGQVVSYSDGLLDERKYYDFTTTATIRPAEVSTSELAARFSDAVRNRLQRTQPNTLLLSGGFDSRFILGTLMSLDARPKIVALEHGTDRHGADGKLALITANYLGLPCDFRRTRRDYYLSRASLETFYILDGMVPTWELFIGEIYQELDSQQGMVWDGLALDVALGGAHQYAGGLKKNLKIFIAKRATNRKLLRQILQPAYFQQLDASFLHRLAGEIDKIPASENRFLFFLLQNRTRRRIAINPHQLFASKINPVTPAADRRFFDYVLSIPASLKLEHSLYTALLREHFATLTKIPVISGGYFHHFRPTSASPGTLSAKKRIKRLIKRIPGVLKLKTKLEALTRKPTPPTQEERDLARLVIKVLDRGGFDRPFYNTERLMSLFARYRKGDHAYHALFMLVFYIELWHRLFLDGGDSIWREFR